MTQQLSEYQAFVRSIESTASTSQINRLLHGALGLASELLELQQARTIGEQVKESGDICYFLTVIVDALGGQIEKYEPADMPANPNLTAHAEAIISEIKRRAFYARTKHSDLEIIFYCNVLLTAALNDCDFVLDVNVSKLRARYPAGHFDADHAMARADEVVNPDENKIA